MRRVLRITSLLAATIAFLPAAAFAQKKGASSGDYKVGYTDLGPVVGIGGIGGAGLSFGGRFEHAFKQLPDLGNGVIGIEASLDYWNYSNRYATIDYDFRYFNIGVTANYHFNVPNSPKIDPFLGLGLGNSSVSTKYGGGTYGGVYFIGRAGVRYFMNPHLALYADAGAGASALNFGVMFGLGGK